MVLDSKMPNGSSDSAPSKELLKFADIYRKEIKVVAGVQFPDRPAAGGVLSEEEEQAREQAYERELFKGVEDLNLSALCLSGGGIRSASFALGVMQGLARFGLLKQFDYLSSVSGGGYIASWLTFWRKQAPDDEVFGALNQSMDTGSEPPQITGIRADSNYLTPRLGLLSGDTWTLITLYVRNLLLNWILFVPFFMACFMIPRIWWSALTHIEDVAGPQSFPIMCGVGAASLFIGLSFGVYGRFRREDKWLTNGRFKLSVLLPLVISGLSFTIASVTVGENGPDGFAELMPLFSLRFLGPTISAQIVSAFSQWPWVFGAIPAAVIYFLAWGVGRSLSRVYAAGTGERIEPLDVLFWTLSGAAVGVVVYIGMTLANHVANSASVSPLAEVAVLGLSGFVVAYLLGELLYVGLASLSDKGDMDREWLARSSGWMSATAIGLTIFSAISIYAPSLLQAGWGRIVGLLTTGGVSGAVTLLLGSSGKTAATEALQALKNVPLMRIASAAAIIFAVAVTSLLALADQSLERLFTAETGNSPPALRVVIILSLILFAAAFALSRVVNVNRFSLHALYRNRLIRAFLGSARRSQRTPDPFTGFDPRDNPKLAETEPLKPDKALFHVINTALNVVAGKNPAWQQRKAESFTMTRLACGNPYVGYRPTKHYGDKEGGISLGTAVAISGAAVSPNQGYNSSPLIGFLLMLFNVRLGWWLGNPRKDDFERAGPTWSLAPALRELAGDTTDDARWVYLSDGGHFENLGLYEMVRRRCRLIIVSDAGCDPKFSFEDLGNAVRKIYIDFGISINFEKLEIKPRQNPPVPGMRFAIGWITYPESSKPGWLLYLKPTYYETTERADIRSYASASPEFPHESTTEQWFSESQLESYRALGASITEFVCSDGKQAPPGTKPSEIKLEALKSLAQKLLDRELDKLEPEEGSKCAFRKTNDGPSPSTDSPKEIFGAG
jgi:Patatin-like phospholipase